MLYQQPIFNVNLILPKLRWELGILNTIQRNFQLWLWELWIPKLLLWYFLQEKLSVLELETRYSLVKQHERLHRSSKNLDLKCLLQSSKFKTLLPQQMSSLRLSSRRFREDMVSFAHMNLSCFQVWFIG